MSAARDAIGDLLYTYAERIDTGDFAGVADLLAHAELSFAGYDDVRRGRDQILALYESTTRRYDDGTPRTKHVMTNVVVEEDGAQATARSYFTVLQAVPGTLALQPVVAGRYHDRFERVDGAWRFQARRILVDLVGDVSAHLSIGLAP
jgi:3-phenylpropionate/cinnamic acid dioxygenase small subunit